MAAPLENVPEALALGHFLNGLKPNIRAEVRLLWPRNLDHAMDLAIMAEDKLRVGHLSASKAGPSFTKPQPTSYYPSPTTKPPAPYQNPNTTITYPPITHNTHQNITNPNRQLTLTPFIPKPTNIPTNQGGVRRLSDKELQHRRENDLCFRCDGKWTAGHQCRRRELSVLISEGDGEEAEEEVAATEEEAAPTDVILWKSPSIL